MNNSAANGGEFDPSELCQKPGYDKSQAITSTFSYRFLHFNTKDFHNPLFVVGPQFTVSENRKRCQHTCIVLSKNKAFSSYTFFRN